MTEIMKNKQLFYQLLVEKSIGYEDELKTDFSKRGGCCFENLYKDSFLVGILRAGIDGMFKNRYKLTEFGKRQVIAFLDIYDYLDKE